MIVQTTQNDVEENLEVLDREFGLLWHVSGHCRL